jgi:hypothetical protein
MTRFLKLAFTAVILLGSASLAVAQDGRFRAASQNGAYGAYAYSPGGRSAYGSMESGPYTPPRRVIRVPVQKVLPFTWEEKRHFDLANGEEG